ncbi:MAG: hypothetical protein M3512_09885 [Bacteroidota bacterium]|nr:hypothetical protein [Bacteroidota bacterium]
MVNLFTTYYNEKDLVRALELQDCLALNVACEVIDKIYVWLENMPEIPIKSSKIVIIPSSKRPTYKDFFQEINSRTEHEDINIIANTDIFFKEDLEGIKQLNFKNKCLALTRWDIGEDLEPNFLGRVDSQDSWIFKGKVNEVKGDFFLGALGCDNKIAFEFQEAGYRVLNPSLSIKSYHLHLSQYRSGLSAYTAVPLPGPYLYLIISAHQGTLNNQMVNFLGKNQVNIKNNNFLMHRLFEDYLNEINSNNIKDFKGQVYLLMKCLHYRPATNKKYLRYFFKKLLKPSVKIWLQ